MQLPTLAHLRAILSVQEIRQLSVWLIVTGGFVASMVYGHLLNLSPNLSQEFIFMYAINSMIFFYLFRSLPQLGVTLLTFNIFFVMAVFGYIYFSNASLVV